MRSTRRGSDSDISKVKVSVANAIVLSGSVALSRRSSFDSQASEQRPAVLRRGIYLSLL
jgi:hypothetical protein